MTGPRRSGDNPVMQVPLSRVVAAMSYALDLTEGEPAGHTVRACKIGMRLAEEIGLDAAQRSRLFYALLLKDAGCSANSAKLAALFGADDQAAKRSSKRVNWSGRVPALVWSLRTVAPRGSLRARGSRLRAIAAEGEVTRALMRARCERGAEIALLLGFEPGTAEAVRALDEHWDGGGQPRGLRGEEIPLLGRILCLAQTAEIFHAAAGLRGAWRVAAARRGGWFDPSLVDAFGAVCADRAFWASLGDDDVSAWEPADRLLVADAARLDQIAVAFAGVVDAKSPWTYRHSDRACVITLAMAGALDADDQLMRDLRRAALLHDIGKLALSNRILDKPAALTGSERAQIREHPLVTERVLRRVPGCEHLAPMAGAHHERLDGSGYPRGLSAADLTTPMRLLALADVYEALTADRPYRAALSSDDALAVIRADVPERFDPESFALLEGLLAGDEPAAGHAAVQVEAALRPGAAID
jgi:HD-GYP domain-containing protein (c-di-GMP phosphodiesterase class II)